MVAGPDASVDLAAAALFIACEEYPDLDVQAYLERLDSMAADLRARLEDTRPGAAVPALNRLLFRDHGFRGNVQDYYDPRNSFLNDVMDRRTGIPISLSTVYMEVGRRAGLLVDGVGLPGHFIVRVGGAAGDGPAMLVDPFHNGVVLTRADCQRRLDRIYDGKLKLATAMLGRCDQKAILGRMLRNLKGIYTRRGDHRRALNVVELLLLVHPSSGEDLRDRGLLFAALDCYGLAARDLEAYVTRSPAAADAEELRGRAAELKRLAARLN
ncbi:MAG TPA: transglutaminase-like domain-containing protein [Vicinamibacteria bacterium]|nr:transglutaminase-like domain-containing protein [Vicinamibacteria bacterium]